jgi:hypothetical protein
MLFFAKRSSFSVTIPLFDVHGSLGSPARERDVRAAARG